MSRTPNAPTRITLTALGVALAITACSATDTATDEDVADVALTSTLDGDAAATVSEGEVALFDSSVVHDIDIEFDDVDYAEMIATYEATGEKDWIEVAVIVDDITIEQAGLRLKGNSSLFGLSSDTAANPEDLPWLIRFDKFVDDQTYQGHADLVIRSNSTETSMNEAVAVELLGVAGLATEEAIATTLTVNGGDTELRLAMEHPDEIWAEGEFDDDDGLLYKADSEGDYTYRGDDPDAYDDVFDQKAGDDDLEPLIDFLDFINNSDDATFASELGTHLDVEAFATYLAFQELVGNFDDIDGPGNNSYLYFDPDSEQFTVVNWDLNLAFDTANVNGGGLGAGGPARGGAGAPDGAGRGGPPPGAPADAGLGATPAGAPDVAGLPAEGPGGVRGGNVLSERFLADDEFSAMYSHAVIDLTEVMFTSGAASDIVDAWSGVLTDQAADLVDASTIHAEAAAILVSIEGA